jgi:hypothetical protein
VVSGDSQRELGMNVRFHNRVAVRASGTASFGTGAERFVDDGFDGARASPTFSAATEAAIDLLGVARQIFRGADGTTDIMVGQDVTGTDDHTKCEPIDSQSPSIFKTGAGCKRKKRLFK